MKYELKRQTKNEIVISVGVLVIGLILAFIADAFSGGIVALLGMGFIINELIRSKDEKFTFDENHFCIGNKYYNYSDIERIESSRIKYTTFVRIIVDGNTIYKFDDSYKGAKEFVKQLTLNNIEHDLFS